jgi:CheY-like chemotaxis protein
MLTLLYRTKIRTPLAQILIVENEPRDAEKAVCWAVHAGFADTVNVESAEAAKTLLETMRAEDRSLPDAILLDLDLGMDSGFDFLRARYETPWLMEIPIVVWTKLADHHRELTDIFKVNAYVPKHLGEHELFKALEIIRLNQL